MSGQRWLCQREGDISKIIYRRFAEDMLQARKRV